MWTWTFEGQKTALNTIEYMYLSNLGSGLFTATFDKKRGLSKGQMDYDIHQTKFRINDMPENVYTVGTEYGKEFQKQHLINLMEAQANKKSLIYEIDYSSKVVRIWHY